MRGLFTGRPPRSQAAALCGAAAAVALLCAPAAPGATQTQRPAQVVERELPALAPPDDGLGRALASGRLTRAEFALERALAVFRPERARRVYGLVERPDPRDGTVILRDLAARMQDLSPSKRALAERVLARPTDRRDAIHGYRTGAQRVCGTYMCFWWVARTADAPAPVDRNRNRVPDWVDATRAVFGTVWRAEVNRFGYRRPLSDRRSRNYGVNGLLDVYVADVGADGLYGYCTSDDPRRTRQRAVSAYCVVDDDFSARQFAGAATGRRALRVTAAHEFFHAVQYAYDWLEDLWFMEGTAAWIEDEIYDGVNDNRQYLRTSPLSPRFFWYPLDYYNRDPAELDAAYKYGVWIFWRYLSERYGRDIVRAVWRNSAGRENYSVAALRSVLGARGADLPSVLSDFGVANLFPASSYSEGAAYPSPRVTKEIEVAATGVARTRVPMMHLSNDYYALRPSGLAPTATLAISLELPPPVASPGASAIVEQPDGSIVRFPAVFDPVAGTWGIRVSDFGAARRVVLVLTNASTRYACWRGTVYACRGRPLDDRDFFFTASVS